MLNVQQQDLFESGLEQVSAGMLIWTVETDRWRLLKQYKLPLSQALIPRNSGILARGAIDLSTNRVQPSAKVRDSRKS